MTRPLRRPIWALGTVICLAVVVAFVNLGFWQLRRLDERRDHNRLVGERMTAESVALPKIVGWGDDADPGDVEYRRVTAAGTWLDGSTVLVRSRALEGQPGFHALATLVLDDTGVEGADPGRQPAVIVNRGFIPLGDGDLATALALAEPPAPTAGRVAIEGVLRRTETRGRIGPADASDGTLDVVNRVDVERLQAQQPEVHLAPLFVQQVLPASGPDRTPQTLPLPDSSNEGSHLSYAGQWFLFAVVGVVGWAALLRKVSKEDERADPQRSASGRAEEPIGQPSVR